MSVYGLQSWRFDRTSFREEHVELIPFRQVGFTIDKRSNFAYPSGLEYRLSTNSLNPDYAPNYDIRWTECWLKSDGSQQFTERNEVVPAASVSTSSWLEYPVPPDGYVSNDFAIRGPNERAIPIISQTWKSVGASIVWTASAGNLGTAAIIVQKSGFVGYDGTGFFRTETVTPKMGPPWVQEFDKPVLSTYTPTSFLFPPSALYHRGGANLFVSAQGRDTGFTAGELGLALGYSDRPHPISFSRVTQREREASDGSVCTLSNPLSDSEFIQAVDSWVDSHPGQVGLFGNDGFIGARVSTFRRYFEHGGVWAYGRQAGRVVLDVPGLPRVPYTLTMRHRYVPWDASGDGPDTETTFSMTPSETPHVEDVPAPADDNGAEVLMELLAPEGDAWWFQSAPVAFAVFD